VRIIFTKAHMKCEVNESIMETKAHSKNGRQALGRIEAHLESTFIKTDTS
jgi:hypothetical protein